MKEKFVLFAFLALFSAILTSCELLVPGPAERPTVGPSGEPAPAGSADPTVDEYGFTVFPEGNYLADPKFDTDEFLPNYDANLSFSHITVKACEAGNTVYFAYDGLLRYADKATGISGPLCGKPECTHNSSDCNAYLNSNILFGLSSYNGRLYWVGQSDMGWKIFSVAYDGTDRREVRELDRDITGSQFNDSYVQFHRGCVYWACLANEVVDGKAIMVSRVFAFPLAPNQEGYVIFEKKYDDLNLPYLKIQAYRNSLYFIDSKRVDGDETGFNYDLAIYQWDIKRRETKQLYCGVVPFDTGYECWIVEDGILMDSIWPTDTGMGYNDDIYKFTFESGGFDLLYNFYSGGKGFSVSAVDGMFVGNSVTDSGDIALLVKDFDGQVVLDLTMEGVEWINYNGSMKCDGADETYLYFSSTRNGKYFTAVPLDGSEIKLLWSSDAESY